MAAAFQEDSSEQKLEDLEVMAEFEEGLGILPNKQLPKRKCDAIGC